MEYYLFLGLIAVISLVFGFGLGRQASETYFSRWLQVFLNNLLKDNNPELIQKCIDIANREAKIK